VLCLLPTMYEVSFGAATNPDVETKKVDMHAR
jgi:hypothetical protein